MIYQILVVSTPLQTHGYTDYALTSLFYAREILKSFSAKATKFHTRDLDHHVFWLWRVVYSTPSHYLKQCWLSANWVLLGNKLWNLNPNTTFFTKENVVCKVPPFCAQEPMPQWVNSVPPYVRKLHFMYEAIRTSGKCRWNIYRTSSKCRWSIYRTSRKRRGTLRIVHKVERSSPTVHALSSPATVVCWTL